MIAEVVDIRVATHTHVWNSGGVVILVNKVGKGQGRPTSRVASPKIPGVTSKLNFGAIESIVLSLWPKNENKSRYNCALTIVVFKLRRRFEEIIFIMNYFHFTDQERIN